MDTQRNSSRRYSRETNNQNCLVRQQFVRGEPCYLGNSLQQFHRRRMLAVHDVADRRLADLTPSRELCLRRIRVLKIGSECFHMSHETIGLAYSSAIGPFDSAVSHALAMAKQLRSVYERAMEALAERHPTQKATQGKLAAIAGVKQPSVNDWKDGYPAMDTAVRLASGLGVCVEWLLTERGPKRPPDANNPTLALLLSQLDDRQKAQLAKLAAVLKDAE